MLISCKEAAELIEIKNHRELQDIAKYRRKPTVLRISDLYWRPGCGPAPYYNNQRGRKIALRAYKVALF